MSKGMYVGVNGTAHKIKKAYVGVDGVARKVKKGYIGINGVARLVYSSEISYGHSFISNTTSTRAMAASATIGNHAIIVGGIENTPGDYNVKNLVSAVDDNLTRTTLASLPHNKYAVCGVATDNHAIFAGGYYQGRWDDVHAYDKNLTRSTLSTLPFATEWMQGARAGEYALMTGGEVGGTYNSTNTVYAFDKNLTRTHPTSLAVRRYRHICVAAGTHAIIAGGSTDNGRTKKVETYDASLTRGTLPDLPDFISGDWSLEKCSAAVSTETHALFAAPPDVYKTTRTVYAYNTDLVRQTVPNLYKAVCYFAGAAVNGCAIFAGGTTDSSYIDGREGQTTTATAYDAELTRANPGNLQIARVGMAGATVGKYAIFVDGNVGRYPTGHIDAYTAE